MSQEEKSHSFPPITECGAGGGEHGSIAADLDGTLLLSRSSFPYFMLVAVEAGSLFRGLILLFAYGDFFLSTRLGVSGDTDPHLHLLCWSQSSRHRTRLSGRSSTVESPLIISLCFIIYSFLY